MGLLTKKSSLILILKVLEEYTDENHYITYQEIIDKIYYNYQVELERKSVGHSIDVLQELGEHSEFGFKIDKKHRVGVALVKRQFEPGEARFLIDAVFSSRAIPAETAKTLADKIQQGFSQHMRKDYGYVAKGSDLSRSDNRLVMDNIEAIGKAIKEAKRISFQMRGYDNEGKPCLRDGGMRYLISPFFIVTNLGRYYVLGCQDGKNELSRYRLDHVVKASIEDDQNYVFPESVLGENFSISKYLDEHVHMLTGEVVNALVRIEKDIKGRKGDQTGKNITFLRDWFGKRAYVFKDKKDGYMYARLRCDASSLFYWIMQYSEEFTLIDPKDRAEEIRDYLKTYLEKYDSLLEDKI